MSDRDYLQSLVKRGFITDVPETSSFADFIAVLKQLYGHYTPEWAAEESGVS